MTFNPERVDFVGLHVDDEVGNQLLQYLKHQSPEVLSRVAQAVTPEIKQIIAQNVQGLIGVLPGDGFNVQITTDRENLAGLLASAMMTGYFFASNGATHGDGCFSDGNALCGSGY